ncbi:DUF2889 domain-containing protein [Granulosicoccaceae sp. 1_MG-2023]|nr:DUF2889 domain-containing protein [Granulosicoccaceae sp. 1_MG-2023]
MALSTPVTREPLHTREIRFQGFRREDGLYDIEGLLRDTKPRDVSNRDRGGVIPAGEPIHEMHVRLTIDRDMKVVAVQGETRFSPFHICRHGPDTLDNLVGAQIGPGWRQAVRRALGRETGCTHITELLITMATAAYQSLVGEPRTQAVDDAPDQPPALLNSCVAFDERSEVVKIEWSAWYRPDTSPAAD